MNIKKPKKIKFKKFKDNPKKYYLIGAGILVPIVAIGLLIFIFGEKVEMVKEIKEQNSDVKLATLQQGQVLPKNL
jgi:hypothetical protein